MFNQKTIRSFSSIILMATVLSICFNGPASVKTTARATSIPVSTPISTLAIDEAANTSIVSSVVSDMDDDGNQVYVWAFSDTSPGMFCNGIRYQRFQMSGLPLTAKTDVISNCTEVTNNHQYLNPSVAMDRTGDFVVTWTDLDPNAIINIKAQTFSSNNSPIGTPVIVQDTDSTMNSNTLPKVALNKNDDPSLMHFAVTWIGCGTTPSCGSVRYEERAQIYTVNFAGTLDPARVNANNLILNPAPYEANGGQVIAFSNNNFLVAWQGYNQTNDDAHWAIFGRAIDMYGIISPAVFQLTNFSSREVNPDLTAVNRPVAHAPDPSDIFYLSFSTDYQGGNNDVYVQKILCTGASLSCASTSRANGAAIFVRANTTTSGEENVSSIRAFSNKNYSDKIYGQESSSSDYFNVTWCSNDTGNNNSKVYSQNFKNDLTRSGTEITVDTLTGAPCNFIPSVALDEDANYAISYLNVQRNQIISKIYQSLYLRVGAEKLSHSPDSNNFQSNPRTAMNSNGNYVITYESDNSNGYVDVIYALYDKNGNAIQNSSFANSLSNADHYSEDVAFFTDDKTSPDYGKFIITYYYDNYAGSQGVYYQLFNADGSKLGGETLVTTDQASSPKVSAGKFKQFLISYQDGIPWGGNPNSIQYLYQNEDNTINGTATDVSSSLIGAPVVTLSPNADGSTGIGGNSKFVIAWNDGTGFDYKEGYLSSSNGVTLNSTQSAGGQVYDVSSAIVPALGTLPIPKNSFMYAFVTINGDLHTQINPYTYGDGPLLSFNNIDLGINKTNPRIAIDKATGNFLVSWEGFNNFTNELNTSQILMFTKDSRTVLSQGDSVSGATSQAQANIAGGDFITNFYYTLANATVPFIIGENISSNLDVPIAGSTSGTNIYFDHDVSANFYSGQIITGQTSLATATVQTVNGNFIFVTNVTGIFQSGETLDNAAGDALTSTDGAYLLDLTPYYSLPYYSGLSLTDVTTNATGVVQYISAAMVNIANLTGSFNAGDTIRTSTTIGNFTPDVIGVIKAQFYRLDFSLPDADASWITKFGPEFSPNTHFNYGQYLASPDIDFDSRSSEEDGKLAIFSYTISGDNTYLDNNGVLQQLVEDPFSVGQKQDLSPLANQQITPGGKYIVVPQLIDFGNIARGATGAVNFSNLTMPDSSAGRLEVTDLDGTDFDLTVSLSTLTNTTEPTSTIPSSNFVIENTDGTNAGGPNPGVTSSYSFTDVNDVTLDPSTAPGQDANLGTTQTLLRKNNNNTGVYEIRPKVKLTIPNDAVNGVYSGTITFTLI